MTHDDAVRLVAGSSRAGEVETWADLGCGDGVFTLALAEQLAAGSTIHAIDRDRAVLRRIPASHRGVHIETHAGDFTRLSWPFAPVDGILMANALHFVADQAAFLRRCAASLTPAGRFLIVEYDTDRPNPWVPYPLSRNSLAALFATVGFDSVETLGSRPSVYQRAALYAVAVARSAGVGRR